MNPDWHEDWLDQVSGRRPDPETIRHLQRQGVLSPAEQRRLAHELALNRLLDGHRPAPAPSSNFTALVIHRVSREGSVSRPSLPRWSFSRVFRAWAGATAAALACMVAAWMLRGPSPSLATMEVAVSLEHATSLSGIEPSTLADFDVVQRLGSSSTAEDDALILALSE